MGLTYKQGDTHNAITSELTKNGKPLKLHGCQVFISVSNTLVKRSKCIILDEDLGIVTYLVGNIAKTNGFLKYEYTVEYPDRTEERFPNVGYESVRIYKSIEGVIE